MTNIKRVSESLSKGNHLLYYAFDHDDNILMMSTVIHMEKKEGDVWVSVTVPTSEYTSVRKDPNYRLLPNKEKSYSEFRDDGPRGEHAFTEDVKKAVFTRNFGPAWDDFIECLTNGSLFAIITARGHEAGPLRKGYEWIIDNVLTESQLFNMYANLRKFDWLFDRNTEHPRFLSGNPSEHPLVKKYLNHCVFAGISSPSRGGSPENPEKSKEEVLLDFKKKVNDFATSVGMSAKIGFSDDDLGNVKHIEDLMDNIKNEQFPNIVSFVVKGTKNPQQITKKVRTYEANIHNQAPGLQSSIIPFSKLNNMRDRMTTDPGEGDKSHRLAADHLQKVSDELIYKEYDGEENTGHSDKKEISPNEQIPYFPL
jgi:hypothetical protein